MSVIFVTGDFMKICHNNLSLVKMGQNILQFTRRPWYILLLPAT
jgi:hypothetical protein